MNYFALVSVVMLDTTPVSAVRLPSFNSAFTRSTTTNAIVVVPQPPQPQNLNVSTPFDVSSETPDRVRMHLEWTGTEQCSHFEVCVYVSPIQSPNFPMSMHTKSHQTVHMNTIRAENELRQMHISNDVNDSANLTCQQCIVQSTTLCDLQIDGKKVKVDVRTVINGENFSTITTLCCVFPGKIQNCFNFSLRFP